jgi:hypothetical protein
LDYDRYVPSLSDQDSINKTNKNYSRKIKNEMKNSSSGKIVFPSKQAIGKGTFGEVFVARIPIYVSKILINVDIAVKKIRGYDDDTIQECEIQIKLAHFNVGMIIIIIIMILYHDFYFIYLF